MAMVTHSRSLAARTPRVIEIRDGRIYSDSVNRKPLSVIGDRITDNRIPITAP
jgi:ABC-type lipoprotein export system ATPase subunit